MANFHKHNNLINKKKVSISYVIRESGDRCHRAGVNSLQYDPTFERLYSAGRDSTIRIWDFSENASKIEGDYPRDNFVQAMEHHTDWVNDISLCNYCDNLISVSNDTTIKVWSTHQGFCLSTLRSHKDYAKRLAYAVNRDIVASAGFDRMIYLWDIQALTMLTATKNTVTTKPLDGSKDSIYSLAINQSATLVASGSTEKVIRLWDPRSRQKLLKLRGHTDNVRDLVFSKDGSLLLSASSDGTIRLWSIGQQRCISIIRIHDGGVWTLQATDAFTKVYSAGRDGKVFVTDLKDTTETGLICEEKAPVLKILLVNRSFHNGEAIDDGKLSLWVATTDSSIKNWPIRSNPTKINDPQQNLTCGVDRPKDISPDILLKGKSAVINYHVLNDKRHILTRESDNSVALYDVLTARKVETISSPTLSEASAKKIYEAELKERSKMVYVPNWFNVDLKIGLLCINLEESECFSAWVSAKDYGFISVIEGTDPKVNLGCLMLRALLELWPPLGEIYDASHGDSNLAGDDSLTTGYTRSNQPFNRSMNVDSSQAGKVSHRLNPYFSVASYIPIMLTEGNQTLLRFLAGDASNENESLLLQELLPAWISDTLINKTPLKFTKVRSMVFVVALFIFLTVNYY